MSEREKALAQGYKDETCSRCGALIEAQIHFIRCDANPCPMKSTADTRTLLKMLCGAPPPTGSERERELCRIGFNGCSPLT